MNMNENQPFARYFLKPAEFNCLYFCLHFYEVFLKNITFESADVVESLEEVLLYCKQCLKQNIRKCVFSDCLSDAYFPEVKKFLIQYYPLTSHSLVIVSIKRDYQDNNDDQ